tara:strand:- start:336 stop:1328 length:993 start_codon:yes stop_codon:yes gene_type:complete
MTLQPVFDYRILLNSFLNKKKSHDRILVKSGRLAFSHIISFIKENNLINKIILPNLICDEIVDVAQYHKVKTEYYNVDEALNYDIDEIEKLAIEQKNIILLVNYFGFKRDHNLSNQLKNNFVILDNAHVLSDSIDTNMGSAIDFSFTSLRKLLPVLSGAEIYSTNNNLSLKQSARFPDIGEMKYSLRSLKRTRGGTSKMGHESYGGDYKCSSIDMFSKKIIDNYNFIYSEIINKRRSNFVFWENYLSKYDITFIKTINDNLDICPYAFPCYVNDVENVEKWIKWGTQKNITIISWPKYHKDTLDYVPENFLRHILLFPVNHQFDLNKIIS